MWCSIQLFNRSRRRTDGNWLPDNAISLLTTSGEEPYTIWYATGFALDIFSSDHNGLCFVCWPHHFRNLGWRKDLIVLGCSSFLGLRYVYLSSGKFFSLTHWCHWNWKIVSNFLLSLLEYRDQRIMYLLPQRVPKHTIRGHPLLPK